MTMRVLRKSGLAGVILVGLAVAGVVAARGAADGGRQRAPRVVEVIVLDLRYDPETVHVEIGDTVRWIQKDAFPHSVTSTSPGPGEPGGFDRPLIEIGETVDIEMTKAGTVEYYCIPHPFMKGRIVVEG